MFHQSECTVHHFQELFPILLANQRMLKRKKKKAYYTTSAMNDFRKNVPKLLKRKNENIWRMQPHVKSEKIFIIGLYMRMSATSNTYEYVHPKTSIQKIAFIYENHEKKKTR